MAACRAIIDPGLQCHHEAARTQNERVDRRLSVAQVQAWGGATRQQKQNQKAGRIPLVGHTLPLHRDWIHGARL